MMKLDNKGVTLLELLIALAILAIVIVPFFDTFIKSVELGRWQEYQVQADLLAQKTLEELKINTDPSITELDRDGFDVEIIWSDKSDEVGLTADSISSTDLEAETTFHGVLTAEESVGSDSGMEMEGVGVPYRDTGGQEALIVVAEAAGSNRYDIFVNGETDLQRVNTVTLTGSDEVNLSIDISPDAPPTEDIQVVIQNKVENHNVNVYEFDDKNDRVTLLRSSENIGDVYFIRNLTGSVQLETETVQTQKYYEVDITVSRNGRVLTELHGSLRSDLE